MIPLIVLNQLDPLHLKPSPFKILARERSVPASGAVKLISIDF